MKVGQLRMLYILLYLKKILKICLKFQDVFTPAWFRPFKAKSSVISLLVAVCLCKLNTDHTQKHLHQHPLEELVSVQLQTTSRAVCL